MELSPIFMFCRNLRKRSRIRNKLEEISIVQRKGQCHDIRFPMSRHYVEKVLTLLQSRDKAATSAKEGKTKIFQCRDIITTLWQHHVNVATVQLNVATSKSALVAKL